MNTTWMSNIMKGQRVGSTPSPIKKRGCSTAKFKGSNSANSSCWRGCKKVGEKESDTRPGVMVNDCDCPDKK